MLACENFEKQAFGCEKEPMRMKGFACLLACGNGEKETFACENVEKEALLVTVVMLVGMLKRKLCL